MRVFSVLLNFFHDTCFGLLVVNGEVMDAALLQQTVDEKFYEFETLVGL